MGSDIDAKRFNTSTESSLMAARSRASASDSTASETLSPTLIPDTRMMSSLEVRVLPCT